MQRQLDQYEDPKYQDAQKQRLTRSLAVSYVVCSSGFLNTHEVTYTFDQIAFKVGALVRMKNLWGSEARE